MEFQLSSSRLLDASRKSSVSEQHIAAITDYVVLLTNHNIQWDAAKVIDSESDKTTRWVKEAIWICRKGKNTLNKDFEFQCNSM